MASKNIKNNKCVQGSQSSDLNAQCAACGQERPEYSLDDKQLCVDCYNAEIIFWKKE